MSRSHPSTDYTLEIFAGERWVRYDNISAYRYDDVRDDTADLSKNLNATLRITQGSDRIFEVFRNGESVPRHPDPALVK